MNASHLRLLADWFDAEQAAGRFPPSPTSKTTEVQDDLRALAESLEKLDGLLLAASDANYYEEYRRRNALLTESMKLAAKMAGREQ